MRSAAKDKLTIKTHEYNVCTNLGMRAAYTTPEYSSEDV